MFDRWTLLISRQCDTIRLGSFTHSYFGSWVPSLVLRSNLLLAALPPFYCGPTWEISPSPISIFQKISTVLKSRDTGLSNATNLMSNGSQKVQNV